MCSALPYCHETIISRKCSFFRVRNKLNMTCAVICWWLHHLLITPSSRLFSIVLVCAWNIKIHLPDLLTEFFLYMEINTTKNIFLFFFCVLLVIKNHEWTIKVLEHTSFHRKVILALVENCCGVENGKINFIFNYFHN